MMLVLRAYQVSGFRLLCLFNLFVVELDGAKTCVVYQNLAVLYLCGCHVLVWGTVRLNMCVIVRYGC